MMPIIVLKKRIPRKRASCHSPNASVAAPATARIRLKIVKTLARTMLAYERLVSCVRCGGRAAWRRRAASASVSPLGGTATAVVAVAIERTYCDSGSSGPGASVGCLARARQVPGTDSV